MRKNLFVEGYDMAPMVTPGASAGNGLVVDRQEYFSAKVNLSAATITSGSIKIKIQTGDQANGSDMADYEVKGQLVESETLTDSNTNTTLDVDLSGAKKYIRTVSTVTGTVSAHQVVAVLGDGQYTDNFFEQA